MAESRYPLKMPAKVGYRVGYGKTGNKKGATFYHVTPCFYSGGRCETRTRDLWFRRPTLYPSELIALFIVLISAFTSEVKERVWCNPKD